eukprot:TRINITY_DN51294_c0_g1_i1.p2 TRINITY_DN51294_c0_g1~~TRINITY_DN51294_c0_g1_i1.p2  ORF type:complete len:230 (-),score=32.42 TRINITY_DN51294_c0_g1_i1:9-698(-)
MFLRCVELPQADSIAAGYKHSAAVCGGKLYTWGAGNQGQLGIGRRKSAVFHPSLVDLGLPAKSVALGRWHSLALTVDDRIWAFGWGRFGVLGQGDTEDHPRPVVVDGVPPPVLLLVSGAVHSGAVCGPMRSCYVWGRGSLGRLGLGSEANALRPCQIPNLEQVEALALGGDFSAARMAGSSEWQVWGKGEEGQLALGDTDRADRKSPVPAPALSGFQQVALGDCHGLDF